VEVVTDFYFSCLDQDKRQRWAEKNHLEDSGSFEPGIQVYIKKYGVLKYKSVFNP